MRYPIPSRSAAALSTIRSKPGNPGLLFDRFAPDWGSALDRDQAEWKKAGLQAVIDQKIDPDLLAEYKHRWQSLAEFAKAVPFTLKTEWRLIAGLGNKGVLEVGFTFHRYGFPILPGSSLKGLARAWALIQVAEQLNTDKLSKLNDHLSLGKSDKYSAALETYPNWQAAQEKARQFRLIFGTTAKTGAAIFFDSIPAKPPQLEMDVINPHFGEYYSGKGSVYPANWLSPVPVPFLTVAPGQDFCFAVGWRERSEGDLRATAEEWLKAALENLGAGGKTSAGYGYFVTVK